MSSPIARAVAELQTERENLTARLAKVDAALATLRNLFHLPTAARVNGTPRAVRKADDAAPTNGRGTIAIDAIRAALHDGPMAPGDLAEQLGVGRVVLRHALAAFEADGLVVSSGVTAGRRVALPGRPAKEAP